MEWKEVTLGDFMQCNPKRTIKKGQKARKITMDLLIPHSKTIRNWNYEPYSGGAKFQNGDTIMARITPCLENGKHAFVSILDEGEIAYGSTEYFVFCGKEKVSDNDFVYYLTKTPLFRDTAIKSMVGSSGRQRAQMDVLENLKMFVPKDISDQRRIASILSSLDRKIELNNKINADLEEMAQAIFKNWFVDFEPFKDGKFVDSELGMIPEGWKVGRLDEIADVVGGSTPSKAKPEYYTQKGIAWLTPKDLSNHPAVYSSRGEIDITEDGYNSTSTKLMPKGTVLFTSRAPIGYISIAQNDICTNQGFKSLVPKKAGTCFLYCFLKYVTPEIENKSTGSTFKEASGSLMKSLQVIIPEQNVFEEFEAIVSPLFARIESLEKENSRLSLLRDTLLPRLMSGELEVPE